MSLLITHICYADPLLWKLLFQLYQQFFKNFPVSKCLKTGIILPFFKGNVAKADNKDKRMTLFPTLRGIYKMILLNRIEKHWKNLRMRKATF